MTLAAALAPAWGAPADLEGPAPCSGSACARQERVWSALQRAAAWMSRFPPGELRFDAAVMLSQIRRRVDGDALRRAFELAREGADRDADHPHRRFWDADARSPRTVTAAWAVPGTGQPRVNPNHVVSEALHCAENGWRPDTTAYVCGAMRDDGGYHTVHGLWALVLARDRGCLDATAPEVAACVSSLRAELAAAQPQELAPRRTLDVDLWAERLLLLQLSARDGGAADEVVVRSVDRLLEHQDADGSFGVRVAGEPAYHRFHATGIATWALAEWSARAAASDAPSATPTAREAVPSGASRE